MLIVLDDNMEMAYQQSHHLKSWKERLLNRFGLTSRPCVKVYHGYMQEGKGTIYGHVLSLSSLPRVHYRQSILRNTWALLRLFMVKPIANASLKMNWRGKEYTTTTDRDGFFRFEWEDSQPLPHGWYDVVVNLLYDEEILAEGKGAVYLPYAAQFGFISDIDDTFLVSHSSHLRKRLLVLFTRNARSRKPFEGVVKHYQLLAAGGTASNAPNPFFYVSSSEWNLYEYILEFTKVNALPQGVFLLNVLKRFSQIFKTGQNNHHTKFMRIVRILEAYPKQSFVLLGDSSQQDPYIYASLVAHFPKQIHAVYIRDVDAANKEKVREVLKGIEAAGVPACFFQHSEEAILHSKKIGLIAEKERATTKFTG